MNHVSASKRLTLSARMALLIFLVEAFLLTGFAFAVWHACRTSIMGSFDRVLVANAEALAALVDIEGDDWDDGDNAEEESEAELELAPEVMQGFAKDWNPDIYAVILDNRTVLGTSPGFGEIPRKVTEQKEYLTHFNLSHADGPYRAAVLSTFRAVEEDAGNVRPVKVFFASSLNEVRRQLRTLALSIATLSGLCLVLTAFLARVVAVTGLRPVSRLAGDIGQVHEERLNTRVSEADLPPELVPVAESVNALIDRIQQAFERERRFSADAAHELRTPVATIKSGIQAALLNKTQARSFETFCEELLEDVERLEELCNALLLLTRGQTEPHTALSLIDWLAEVEAAVHSVCAGENGSDERITLLLPEGPTPDVLLSVDRASTFRITSNLAGNAVRYAGAEAGIRVSAEYVDGRACLTIEDDGQGIPSEDEMMIFERFYRVDKSRTRELGGFGLGLSICQTLAASLGGRISYERNVPHGCRFRWTLAPTHETPHQS